MDPKSIFQSKVFWANVLALAIWAFGLFGVVPAMSAEVQEFATAMGPAIIALVNLALRFVTKQPVTLP